MACGSIVIVYMTKTQTKTYWHKERKHEMITEIHPTEVEIFEW
jgi:hypothetical protein